MKEPNREVKNMCLRIEELAKETYKLRDAILKELGAEYDYDGPENKVLTDLIDGAITGTSAYNELVLEHLEEAKEAGA